MCAVRALAGAGSAIASPASFGIIGVTFGTGPSRSIAFAILAMGNPVGGAIGPVIGGVLFYVLAGLTAISITLGALVIPRDLHKKDANRRIDWLGGILVTTSVCLFTFSITQSGIAAKGWREPCNAPSSRFVLTDGERRRPRRLEAFLSPSSSSSSSGNIASTNKASHRQ